MGLENLFLMDTRLLKTSELPHFYCELFKAWSVFKKKNKETAVSLHWLLEEPVIGGARLDVEDGSTKTEEDPEGCKDRHAEAGGGGGREQPAGRKGHGGVAGGEVHPAHTPGADQMEEGFNRGGTTFIEGIWRRDYSDRQPGGVLWETVGQGV